MGYDETLSSTTACLSKAMIATETENQSIEMNGKTENESIEMSGVLSGQHVYHEIRRLIQGGKDEAPLLPWEMLHTKVPRYPVVFAARPNAGSAGDSLPFFRAIVSLAKTFPGDYYVAVETKAQGRLFERVFEDAAKTGGFKWADVFKNVDFGLKIFDDPDHSCGDSRAQWIQAFGTLPDIDVLITNQCREKDRFVDQMRLIAKTRGIPEIIVECVRYNVGWSDQEDKWRDDLAKDQASMEEYRKWSMRPKIDQKEVQRQKTWTPVVQYLPPESPKQLLQVTGGHKLRTPLHHEDLMWANGRDYAWLRLECFPTELLTVREFGLVSNILSGILEPLCPANNDYATVRRFVDDARKAGRKVVMLARGGGWARDWRDGEPMFSSALHFTSDGTMEEIDLRELSKVMDHGAALKLIDEVSVIALSTKDGQAKQVHSRLFALPYLDYDLSEIFPLVNIVVHHGGCGTMITALKSGVPQIVIPNATGCADQLGNGSKIEALRCGYLLRPYDRLDDECDGLVVKTVSGVLRNYPALQEACATWQAKLNRTSSLSDLPLPVDMLRRVIDDVLFKKEARKKKELKVVEKSMLLQSG